MNKTIGASLLVSGCCIGVGMLGVPVVTGSFGFFPSMVCFFVAWLFMLVAGYVLIDLNRSFEERSITLCGMAKKTLGTFGTWTTWIFFALLFYAIMTAYVIGGSLIIGESIGLFFEHPLTFNAIAIIFCLFIYFIITLNVHIIDLCNRWLMGGLILSYLALTFFALPYVEKENLLNASWSGSWSVLPIMAISFGYHNLIPSLNSYLKQEKTVIYKAVFFGSLFVLCVYVLWQFVIMGIVPKEAIVLWKAAENHGDIVTKVIVETVASEKILWTIHSFAFFAIATSFLAVAFSFFDFLKDSLFQRSPRWVVSFFVLLPPFYIAISNPHFFLKALSYAGGFCTMVLFGILPVLMLMKRKKKIPDWFRKESPFFSSPVVLWGVLITAIAIIVIELYDTFIGAL